jgi:hypothetical protein
MLALDVIRDGRSISLELPVPIDILCGELRNIGVYKPLAEIQRADVLLQPTNALGDYFMKLVQPDDSLQAIAMACRETDVLVGESREALVTMLMADRFSDLDQMNDYLRYGPAALEPQHTESPKPKCPLVGADGNVFNLIGLAAATLRENSLADQAKEMRSRAMEADSYDGALGVIMEYVEPVCAEGFEDEDEDWCNEPEYDESLDAQGFDGMGGMC